jgi:nitroimidazol reductase NimA-like FMN-containing flavoprotein (pyridoxamine 5'-phosphate oxidase superfamily)
VADSPPRVTITDIDRQECERLLATAQVGRLGVVAEGQPHVVPVNYATPGGGVIVFRTDAGSILTEASLRQVAFEVDQIDAQVHAGWSVEVHGFGRDIADANDAESVRLRALPLVTWAPGDRPQWFKIIPAEVTGRRLTPT